MKRVLSILLALTLLTTLFSACGKEKEVSTPLPEPAQTPEVPETTTEKKKLPRYLEDEELYYYDKVYEILKDIENKDLATPVSFSDSSFKLMETSSDVMELLHPSGKLSTCIDASIGYPFIDISAQMHANPFNNFNTLKKNKLVIPHNSKDNSVIFDFSDGYMTNYGAWFEYNLPTVNFKSPKHKFSKSGCVELLRKIHILESANIDTSPFIHHILERPEDDAVAFSRKDNCYYTYLVRYDTGYAEVVALYFKSSDDKYIDEITTQLLFIEFPANNPSAGVSLSLADMRYHDSLTHFSLFMAVEKALSGTCKHPERCSLSGENPDVKFVLPESYESKNYTVKIKKEVYRAANDDYPADPDYYDITDDFLEFFTNYTYTIKLK